MFKKYTWAIITDMCTSKPFFFLFFFLAEPSNNCFIDKTFLNKHAFFDWNPPNCPHKGNEEVVIKELSRQNIIF